MKILVVTNDDQRFEVTKKCVSTKFVDLEMVICNNSESALNYLTTDGPFAFFMMDMQIKEDQATLLNKMIDLSGERPIIICGEEEDLDKVNKSLLIKNEGNTVLRDLEDEEKIFKIISSALNWSKQNNFDEAVVSEKNESEYIGLKIGNLYMYDSFPHNLYVKISNQKYVISIEKDTQIYHSQIAKLVQRRIRILYLEKDLHLEFLENSLVKAKKYYAEKQEFNKKAIMAHLRSAALIQDYLVNVGVTTKITEVIHDLLEHMIVSLDSIFSFNKVAEHYNFKFESVISKAITSAYICYYMMKELGWKGESTRKKFILASILQDSFLEEDDQARISTHTDPMLSELNEAQRNKYFSHPSSIAQIARQLTQFPDLDFLLEQHHERPGRDGFPLRPAPSELQMAVCLFNIASEFSREIDGLKFTTENYKKVLAPLEKQYAVGNFKEPFTALKKALGIN